MQASIVTIIRTWGVGALSPLPQLELSNEVYKQAFIVECEIS